MNLHMQKLLDINKKKGLQADNLIKRCIELEKMNSKLLTVMPKDRNAPNLDLEMNSVTMDEVKKNPNPGLLNLTLQQKVDISHL
mmetsp:Transcript_39172/g.37545  ORF Transcript_39172/g.37545 Transcript_39172/m.37545 type:complete len:84 (+) Transcript_39172:914-1165(+)